MTKHESLIRRLCEASEGSAELSAEVWTALQGAQQSPVGSGPLMMQEDGSFRRVLPCLTTSLSAAWAEAKRKGCLPELDMEDVGQFQVTLWRDGAVVAEEMGCHEACTICAALLAAEGER